MGGSNWHRYAAGVLGAILAVSVAIGSGVVGVPPELQHAALYAGIVTVFLQALLPTVLDSRPPPPT